MKLSPNMLITDNFYTQNDREILQFKKFVPLNFIIVYRYTEQIIKQVFYISEFVIQLYNSTITKVLNVVQTG